MTEMKYEYLDDIMSKANYALSDNIINLEQYIKLITTTTDIIKELYVKELRNVK